MENHDFNYYELLRLDPDSSADEIRESINQKIRKVQADANSPNKEVSQRASEEMKILIEARRTLLDATKRKEYDKTIKKYGISKLERPKKDKVIAVKKPQLSYSIALLLDTSGSMWGEKIQDAKEALHAFLETLDLDENEVALVNFGDEVTATDGLTQESNYIKKKIGALEANGGTPMMQAIKIAHEEVLKKGGAKPVMVIATDGIPTDSSEEEILDYAAPIKESGTWIITIGIGEDVNKEFLKRLASSPKDYHFAKESFKLKEIYKKVVSGLVIKKE